MTAANHVDSLIRVEEVAHAAYYAGDLFHRAFGSAPPDFPAHLVAMYKAARNCFVTLGYLHVSVFGDLCLCGGLAVDERAIRRMPATHQADLHAGRGVARHLLDEAVVRFAHMPALWAMVGDAPVRALFEQARFAATDAPYLMVRWDDGVDARGRDDLLRRVIAFGPF